MIRIGKIHSHLGDGVYSMLHDSCDKDAKTEFFVSSRSPYVNYNPADGMVDCPWCHVKVALDVVVNNSKRERIEWRQDNTGEEQK